MIFFVTHTDALALCSVVLDITISMGYNQYLTSPVWSILTLFCSMCCSHFAVLHSLVHFCANSGVIQTCVSMFGCPSATSVLCHTLRSVFLVVLACHLLVLDGFDQLLSLALSTLSLSKQCSCR